MVRGVGELLKSAEGGATRGRLADALKVHLSDPPVSVVIVIGGGRRYAPQ
jgi:hypothetical protein